MIKSLRKRHLQIWALWAVLMPVGIIAAWLAVPQKAVDKLLQPEAGTALPVAIQSVEKESYIVTLRSNKENTQYQLQWINRKPSTVPSSLIYKVSPPENELVGRVDARGTYYFPLGIDSNNMYRFILYDIIKKRTIDSVNFKTPL
jgi:hypothetical protein